MSIDVSKIPAEKIQEWIDTLESDGIPFYPITEKKLNTLADILVEAGSRAERQENGFIAAINDAVIKNMNEPITLKTKGDDIKGVMRAEKYKGRQSTGSEPYTDVVLYTKTGIINISMKGDTAASLAGGGLRGLELIIPGIAQRFMRAVYDHLIKLGLKEGDKIPDTYAKLNAKDKNLIVIGNVAMGGPIDYMYVGPMDVKDEFKDGVLTVNGELTSAIKYANKKELYFRLRARRVDQTFDPYASTSNGTPKIYGKSPSKGDSAGRIVITDTLPGNAKVITF